MTSSIWRIFLRGLVVVVPVVLTVALIIWFGTTLETLLGGVIRVVLPEDLYFDGLGLVVGIASVFLVGIATQVWLTRQIIEIGERILERIPLAKTIYSSARDLMEFVSKASDPAEMKKVVLVTVAEGIRMIGFITQDNADVAEIDDSDDHVVVYLQMSYQMGGYTVFVPRDRVQELDMDLEEAMRWLLTAGMSEADDEDG